jgi:hypothetical protein
MDATAPDASGTATHAPFWHAAASQAVLGQSESLVHFGFGVLLHAITAANNPKTTTNTLRTGTS